MLGLAHVLAVNNFGDTRSGGLAGPMGLFIIVLLIIGTVLLIRNMNMRLRRLPDEFPDPEAVRREEELARLEADLAAPDATDPARPTPDAVPNEAGSGSEAHGSEADAAGSDGTDVPRSTGRRDARE